jgi:RecA-family ATPase
MSNSEPNKDLRAAAKARAEQIKNDAQASQTQQSTIGVVSGDFFVKDLDKPKEIIRDLLYHDSFVTLTAASKVGKTWLLLLLGVCVSLGKEWLGYQTVPGHVLYIGFELRNYTLQQRLKAICKALGVEFSSLAGKLDIVNRRGRSDNSPDVILGKSHQALQQRSRGWPSLFNDHYRSIVLSACRP